MLEEAKSLIQDICDDHLFAAEAVLNTPELKEALKEDIKNECQELIEYIHASKRFKLEVNSRSKDRVVSFGERLSCRFMAYVLRDRVRTHRGWRGRGFDAINADYMGRVWRPSMWTWPMCFTTTVRAV